MSKAIRWAFRGWLLALLASGLVTTDRAWGNAAPPWEAGQSAAEATGVPDAVIAGEKLVIDFRRLAQGGLVSVEATYQLRCEATDRPLPLVFVTGLGRVRNFRVEFDGAPIKTTARTIDPREHPPDWQPPNETPGIDASRALPYPARNSWNRQFEYTLPLTGGQHTMQVRYEVDATAHWDATSPTRYWQMAYILSPARAWAGFEGLSVELLIPDNWLHACSLPLTQEGNRLVGQFDSIPAEHLAITVRSPAGAHYYRMLGMAQVAIWASLIACPICMLGFTFFLGMNRGRRGLPAFSAWVWLVLLACLVGWIVAWCGSVVFYISLQDWALPAHQQPGELGYLRIFAFIGAILTAVVFIAVGMPLQLLCLFLGRTWAGNRQPVAESVTQGDGKSPFAS